MKDLNRLYTNPLSNDHSSYEYVRILIQGIMAAKGQQGRVLLITGQMQQTEMVEKLVKAPLSKTRPTQFPGTKVNVIHKAVSNFQSIPQEAFVALGLSSDELLALEDDINTDFMVVAPWLPGSVDKWARITGASLIPGQVIATPYPQVDCLLEQAFLNLRSIGDDASHRNDRSLIKTVFTVVLENNIPTNIDEMEAYLFVKSGWSKRKINKVLDIHNKLKAGQHIQEKILDNRDQMYERWKNACETDTE